MSAVAHLAVHDFATARFHMVEGQVRPNNVRDPRILEAMGRLPRERFVPPPLTGIAYSDEDVQVAPNRWLLEPMVLARLLQGAEIGPSDRVLDVGPATGYSTAVIAAMAGACVAVEVDPALQGQAAANLDGLGISNAEVRLGKLTEGWKAGAPYDVIFINGGVEAIPETLSAQMKEGGRLVAVVRRYGPARASHTGEARLYEKLRGALSCRPLFDAHAPLLPGFEVPVGFVF